MISLIARAAGLAGSIRATFPGLCSRLPARILGLVLAVLGLCLLAPAPARAQPVQWNQLYPSLRYSHAMAYDAARGVTVLFGGAYSNSSGANGETWEWNGTAWTWRAVSGPAPRDGHAVVYDAARGVTVLFGGRTSSGA
jgi:hypothetical protein